MPPFAGPAIYEILAGHLSEGFSGLLTFVFSIVDYREVSGCQGVSQLDGLMSRYVRFLEKVPYGDALRYSREESPYSPPFSLFLLCLNSSFTPLVFI